MSDTDLKKKVSFYPSFGYYFVPEHAHWRLLLNVVQLWAVANSLHFVLIFF